MRLRRHALAFTSAFVTAIVIIGGCASDEEADTNGSSTSSSGSITATSSGGASSGNASGSSSGTAQSSGGTTDGSIPDVQFTYDAPSRPDADACALDTKTAQLKHLDTFIMLDRSGSMNYPCGVTKCEGTPGQPQALGDCNVGDTLGSKWCHTINALSTYFKSSAAANNAAGLQVFIPYTQNNTPKGAVTLCTAAEFGQAYYAGSNGYLLLPSSGFDSVLNSFVPQGSTPMVPAAKGISSYTASHMNAGRITIGVLITDGDPSAECFDAAYPQTLQGQLDTIKDSFQTNFTNNGIITFVIGMDGATFSNLEYIAGGGNAPMHGDTVGAVTDACGNGGGPCRHFNIGDGSGNKLAEALKQIQGFAIACKYDMPKPTGGGAININDVTVEYLQNGQPPAVKLVRVNDAGSCVANGFYYDSNSSPTQIQLCSQQCTTVQADANAKINVQLGCLGG